jgi:hypothetical protein
MNTTRRRRPKRFSDGKRAWTFAYIVALAPNSDKSHVSRKDILGVSLDYYAPLLCGGCGSRYLRGVFASRYSVPGAKGYHFSSIFPLSLPERASERAALPRVPVWLPAAAYNGRMK